MTDRPARSLGRCRRVLAVLLLGLGSACASRTLTIESTPPGAEVWLDQRPIGLTPVTVEERYGGVHEILVLKDRFQPSLLYYDTTRFVFDVPPFDAVVDLGGGQDHQVVQVTLAESTVLRDCEADRDNVLEALRARARTLRERLGDASDSAAPR